MERPVYTLSKFLIFDDDITAAENCVIINMKDIIESEAFLFIPKSALLRYLRNCTKLSPSIHWSAMIKWMEHNMPRNDDFLMSGIRIVLETKHVSLMFLLRIVWNHPRVQSSAETKRILVGIWM